MENMEDEKFSEDWKAAFEDAGIKPSVSVWSNIDLKLENEKMKRRVIYYQRLAAASIFFALLLGAFGVQYFNNRKDSLATSTPRIEPEIGSENLNSTSSVVNKKPSIEHEKQLPSIQSDTKKNEEYDGGRISSEHSILNQVEANRSASDIASANRFAVHKIDDRTIKNSENQFARFSSFMAPHLSKNEPPQLKKQNELIPLVSELPELTTTSKSQRKKNEDLWLSFGAGAGSYNPGNGSQSLASSSLANQNLMDSKPQSMGTAYSMGLTVGKKIGERWVMQTGINYMNQMLSYTSNFASYDASNRLTARIADYAGTTPLTMTQPYKVNNNLEFVSVPVQAGFLIINRKVGLQFNAGFASDIFLRNTLQDQSGQLSKYSKGSGDGSPYRPFNLAGLASTELSYKIAHHYRISLMPGLRYSFQPLLKSPSTGTTTPFVLDIGFRFKYIFK
jgi:hypothetical protein